MRMPKYLITGGCGFIGSHLADRLIEQGCEVVILDDLSTGKKEQAPHKAELLIGSITDPSRVARALQGVDGVFHLAALPSIQNSLDHWYDAHRVNLGGTILLFEALAKSERKVPLIFASSSAVYGDSPLFPLQEQAPPSPLSPYGIDKLSGEWQAKVLWNCFRIPSISFRFFNVFGPRQDPSSPYSGVISIFSKALSQNIPLTIYRDGQQVRDFIYVQDVVRIMATAMSTPMQGAEIYNLCTGTGTTINQLADLMGKIGGTALQKVYAPAREGDIRLSIGDPAKVKRALQLEPRYSLEEGLKSIAKQKFCPL